MDGLRDGEKFKKTRGRVFKGENFLLRIILVLGSYPVFSSSSTIRWVPDLEWNTETNWENNIVPKNGTHVVFPVEMRLSVGLPVQQTTLDIAGIELPRDGAIALPQSGLLTLSQASPASKTVHWSREGPLLWVEPNNWNSERSSKAVPHLERIPCQDDTVILPELKRMVSIQLPDTFGSSVEAVRVTGDTGNLPSWEWRSVSTQREFYARPTSVGYTGLQSCLDCSCQSEKTGRELLTEVCRTPGALCPNIGCDNPIQIEGHCCHYCGGRVIISSDTPLSLAKTVSNLALGDYGSKISWYARKTWDSKKEILIAGKNEYSMESTLNAIDALSAALKEQGIEVISIDTTGGEVYTSRWVAITGPFLGTLFIAILLLLVAFPYFGYSLPQVLGESWRGLRDAVNNRNIGVDVAAPILPRKGFKFAKFENAPEAEVELAAAATATSIVTGTSSSSGEISAGRKVVTDEEYEEDDDDEAGRGEFANPLYRSVRRIQEPQSFSALKKRQDDIVADEVDLTIP